MYIVHARVAGAYVKNVTRYLRLKKRMIKISLKIIFSQKLLYKNITL